MSKPDDLETATFRPEDLANADHDVLKRLLGESGSTGPVHASHASHASGSGRGHSSFVGSMTPSGEEKEHKSR